MPSTFLERWIIAVAIEKNPDLRNNKETRFLRQIHVVGIFNAKQGESTSGSRRLRKPLVNISGWRKLRLLEVGGLAQSEFSSATHL